MSWFACDMSNLAQHSDLTMNHILHLPKREMRAYKETHTVFLEMVSAGIVYLLTMVHPQGYSKFQLTGMVEWGQKSNPKKSLGLLTTPRKIPGPNITPKKSHAEFPNLKNFQKGLNDITRKKKTARN